MFTGFSTLSYSKPYVFVCFCIIILKTICVCIVFLYYPIKNHMLKYVFLHSPIQKKNISVDMFVCILLLKAYVFFMWSSAAGTEACAHMCAHERAGVVVGQCRRAATLWLCPGLVTKPMVGAPLHRRCPLRTLWRCPALRVAPKTAGGPVGKPLAGNPCVRWRRQCTKL